MGTDKRNPLFTVYAWEEDEDEEQLHVYYGLELLEVVSADRNAASFKMLVGRLYNAGLSQKVKEGFEKIPKIDNVSSESGRNVRVRLTPLLHPQLSSTEGSLVN